MTSFSLVQLIVTFFLQIACGSPFLPANSKAEISLKDGVFTSKLICKPGYKLQGQQYSSCLSNRAWENNMQVFEMISSKNKI